MRHRGQCRPARPGRRRVSDDLHLRLLRRVARRARRDADIVGATADPQSPRTPLQRTSDVAGARLAAAQARRRGAAPAAPSTPHEPRALRPDADAARQRDPSIAELRALLAHAVQQLALYRRRVYLGWGEPRRLAELERIAAGARHRLTRSLARRSA